MLLEKLKEYAERLDPIPVMYKKTNIHWIIDLDENGQFLNIVQTAGGEEKNWRGQEFVVPHLERSGRNPPPIILADKGEYTLGLIAPSESSDGKVTEEALKIKEKHNAYCKLIDLVAQQTNEPSIYAIQAFLNSYRAEQVVFQLNDTIYGGTENTRWLIELAEQKKKNQFVRMRSITQYLQPSDNSPSTDNINKITDFVKNFNLDKFILNLLRNKKVKL